MSPPRVAMSRRPAAIIFGAWTLWGLVWSVQVYASSRFDPQPTPFVAALLGQVPLAWVWALATPGILWLGRALPPLGTRWALHGAVHMIACLGVVYATNVFYVASVSLMGLAQTGGPIMARANRSFVFWVLSDGLLYWTPLIVDHLVRHYREARERELRASQLEAQLTRARLDALKMQLHPHFLFNALHTVGTLVRTGQDATAVQIVARLGELLRRVLEGAATQLVALKDELEFVRNYLEIEEVRFPDRLRVTFDIEPAALDASVPHLILQPLVENAIHHGIAPHAAAGRLVVAARKANHRLRLTVRDDGPGPPDPRLGGSEGSHGGLGLANTRARLAELYGADFTLDVSTGPGAGTEARIEIPFRLAASEWQPAG